MRSLREFLDVETCLQRFAAEPFDDEDRKRRRRVGRDQLGAEGWSVAEARHALRQSPIVRRRFAMAWRDACEAEGVELTGARRLAGWKVARGVLGAVGLALGVVAAQAACASPSGSPVNLWLFLGLLVLLPIGTLLVLGVAAAWTSSQDGTLRGVVMRFARWLQRRAGKIRIDPGSRARRIESWLAFSCSQFFATAFSVGSLIGFAALLGFTELGFGWASTPDGVEPTLLQGVVDFLAAPWAWAFPDIAPTQDLLHASRWSAMDASFPDAAGSSAAELADGWWPFLLISVSLWSLLPRLILLVTATVSLRRALGRQTWDHRDLIELFEQMLPTGEGWSRMKATGAPRPDHRAEAAPPPARADGSVAAIIWGGWHLDESAWTSGTMVDYGLHHAARLHAGGRAWEADAQALALLAELDPTELWVLVEAGEAPDKRLLGFLRDLRRQLANTTLRIGLLDWRGVEGWATVHPRDAKIWRRTLDTLEDDRLWTGVLGPETADSEEHEDDA